LISRSKRSLDEVRLSRVARRVIRDRLTYLSIPRIRNIERCIRDVNRRDIRGDFVEAGVALGGSAIIMASHMGPGRSFHGYDVFGQIPPPTEADDPDAHDRYQIIASGNSEGLGGDDYYGYVDDLYGRVVSAFRRHGLEVDGGRIALHRGVFEETMEIDQPVAVAHLDCDWYEPVRFCLEQVSPRLSEGGYIIVDDYNSYGGCARAVDEHLASHSELERISADSNLVLQRR
jgi:O-methyltransferase